MYVASCMQKEVSKHPPIVEGQQLQRVRLLVSVVSSRLRKDCRHGAATTRLEARCGLQRQAATNASPTLESELSARGS